MWRGEGHLDSQQCELCNDIVVPGARYCENCGNQLFMAETPVEILGETNSNFHRVSNELGLVWHWILRGRPGLRLTEGKAAKKLLKRAESGFR